MPLVYLVEGNIDTHTPHAHTYFHIHTPMHIHIHIHTPTHTALHMDMSSWTSRGQKISHNLLTSTNMLIT